MMVMDSIRMIWRDSICSWNMVYALWTWEMSPCGKGICGYGGCGYRICFLVGEMDMKDVFLLENTVATVHTAARPLQ